MRFADMLRLSLSALWQQKVRTILTVAGIAIGAFVLAIDLSLEQGFNEEVDRQLRHGDQLRQIWVFANKRNKPPILLTEATVAKIRGLPHVESAAPMINEVVDVCLSRDLLRPERVATGLGLAAAPPGQSLLRALPPLLPWDQPAVTFIARPTDDYLRDRLVAGRYLSSTDANEVLVSKRLLDRLALGRSEPVEWFLDQKLNFVYPSSRRNTLELNRLLNFVDVALEPAESQAVRKVVTQLWTVSNHSNLTVHDRDAIARILQRKLHDPSAAVPRKDTVVPGKEPVVPNKDAAALKQEAEERAALAKVRKEFEAVSEDLKLTDADRDALAMVLRRYLDEPQDPIRGQLPFHEDTIIVGVLRDYRQEDDNLGLKLAAYMADIDLFLSPGTSERLFRHKPKGQEVGYHGVFVTVDQEDNLKEVVAAIKTMGLQDYSLQEVVDKLVLGMALSKYLTSFLALMGGLAAALGITNIMFMSVLERTREIGVMKAVGARDRHIQLIFLIEGGLLGVLGGGFGVLGCWLASFPGDAYARQLVEQHTYVRHLRHSLFVFPWWLVLGVPFFAVAVTTLAAVLPARRAAKVNPIQALRHE